MTTPPRVRARSLAGIAGQWALLLACLILPLTGGCVPLAFLAHAVTPDEKDPPPPRYTGLSNRNTAIMVWSDVGMQSTFPDLQLHTAQALQAKLTEGRDKCKDKELVGLEVVDPGLVRQFQLDHPDLDGAPAEEIAPRMGLKRPLDRLIYVELREFETHPPEAIALFRGTAVATVRVIEVGGPPENRVTKAAFREDDIRVIFPPKSKEGVPMSDGVDDRTIYVATVRQLADELSKRFYMPEDK